MENIIDAKEKTEWKAWIDKERKVLHIQGQISINDASLSYELGKTEQGYLDDELLLEITPKLAPGEHKVTLNYEEPLQADNNFQKITIKSGSEEVASLLVK